MVHEPSWRKWFVPGKHQRRSDADLHRPLDAASNAGAAAPRGRGNSFTVLTSYSMVKLPEKPMQGRLFDERVGYFSQSMYDYSRDEH
jgi:hypothetical protein